jgi:hypothetical protein
LDVLQSATVIILEYVFCLLSVAFLAIEAVNSSVWSAPIHTKPWLHTMQDQILLTLCWHWVLWWGNICAMRCFNWKGCHNFIYELLPQCDT